MTDWQDPDLIRRLLSTPAPWAVVGLSANSERTAYRIGRYLRDRLGMSIVPVNLRGEDTLGETGYVRLADVPGPIDVVDCFVNSQRVGAVVDDAIAEKDRLGIKAVWLQLGAQAGGPGAPRRVLVAVFHSQRLAKLRLGRSWRASCHRRSGRPGIGSAAGSGACVRLRLDPSI